MTSLHRIAAKLLFIMTSLISLCPKRCHSLRIFPHSTRRLSHRSHHESRLFSSQRRSHHYLFSSYSRASPLSSGYYSIYHRGGTSKNPHRVITKRSFHTSWALHSSGISDPEVDITTHEINLIILPLQEHLSQLEGTGKLSKSESKSILDAIAFRDPDGLVLDHVEMGVDNNYFSHHLLRSLEIYIEKRDSRRRSNDPPIKNEGSYVRSVFRNQVKNAERGRVKRAIEIASRKSQLSNYKTTDNESIPTHPNLQSFIQDGQITAKELNGDCIHILSQSSAEMVNYALEAYIRQKQRRVVKGIEPISDPSSYVLTILRNAPKEKEGQPPSERDAAPTSVFTNHPSSTHDNNDVDTPSIPIQPPSAATTTNKSPPKSAVTMSHVDATLHLLHKLNQPISTIKGVGPKTEAAFHKLGLITLRDLLWHFPRKFIDRSVLQSDIQNVPEEEIGTVRLTVGKDSVRGSTITCTDESGNNVDVTFFYGKSHRGIMTAKNELKKICNYHSIVVSGKVQHSHRRSTMFNPDKCVQADEAESVLGIEPVYALSSGLRKSVLINAIHEALQVAKELLECIPESLSDEALEVMSWPKLADALTIAHQPLSMEETGPNSPARERLAFEELRIQQAQIALMRWNLKYSNVQSMQQQQQLPGCWHDSPLVAAAVESLPFQLTQSQQECLAELWSDAILDTNSHMIRLLQGEVGSGKTVLAYLIALGCIETRQGGGRVAAILAPTQLLALQHAASIADFAVAIKDGRDHSSNIRNIHVEILTGAVTGKQREALFQRLEATTDDDAVILIGTHALATADIVDRLQKLPSVSSSTSKGLALSVVDEEQRFGVLQREALSSCAANTLFMSATPIPRTFMASRGNGLMDYTKLESAMSRTVKTTIASAGEMERVISSLQNKIDVGSKCFWVLPRIGYGENDDPDSQQASVESRYHGLIDIFGESKVGFVHGRMRIEDREKQLAAFAEEDSEMVILVGTTVIEVGIDIPNVNLLIVEQAERFGLSQLHQLRGRIGRNGSKDDLDCHCLLLTDATNKDDSTSLGRLEILRETGDGAAIAEADLMLRGAGDVLGFIQSGIKSGYAVDPTYHWEMIPAASSHGRSFLLHPDRNNDDKELTDDGTRMQNESSLVQLQYISEVKALHDDAIVASSQSGFALRVMMLLFGEKDHENVKSSLAILQKLMSLKGASLSRDDHLTSKKIAEIAEGSTNTLEIAQQISMEKANSPIPSPKPAASQKPKIRMLTTKKNTLDFLDDICFILLDVETTGLKSSDYVIQLAGKELGSSTDDEFAEYILPPVEVPKIVEDLTGITDDFLRSGDFKTFNEVYLEFQDFCTQQAQGRNVCFVAHNAKFDIDMINCELKRWKNDDKSAPVLADIFSASLDTLALFKTRRFWTTPNGKPPSFKLGIVYEHVFSENITNAHNAIGDIRALDRLLLSNHFAGWKSVGNTIQQPFIKVT